VQSISELICGALSHPYLPTHLAIVLAHSKRATAQVIAGCIFIETEKSGGLEVY
jgi:hypothetical protein